MFKREIEAELQELIKTYPTVTIIGPRQSGKTTLARHSFANKSYANLEAPDTRLLAEEDPRGFLEQFPEGAGVRAPKGYLIYAGRARAENSVHRASKL